MQLAVGQQFVTLLTRRTGIVHKIVDGNRIVVMDGLLGAAAEEKLCHGQVLVELLA